MQTIFVLYFVAFATYGINFGPKVAAVWRTATGALSVLRVPQFRFACFGRLRSRPADGLAEAQPAQRPRSGYRRYTRHRSGIRGQRRQRRTHCVQHAQRLHRLLDSVRSFVADLLADVLRCSMLDRKNLMKYIALMEKELAGAKIALANLNGQSLFLFVRVR